MTCFIRPVLLAGVLAFALDPHSTAWAMGGKRPPPGTVAANITVVAPSAPESCKIESPRIAPGRLTEDEGRLIPVLRALAREAHPAWSLTQAAKRLALGDRALGLAMADLAVTGRRAFKRFKALHDAGLLTETTLVDWLRFDPELAGLPDAALSDASREALDRAYHVIHALDRPDSLRDGLGWIAVSGEDDAPYRPVNVSSAPYPQFDTTIVVGGHRVRTRYMIAESLKPAKAPAGPPTRSLPAARRPVLSRDAKVLLFVHGMDSRLEESLDLFEALKKIGQRTGENWTMVAVDLPGAGYADKLDHRAISPLTDLGVPRLIGFDAHGRQNVPILDFIEQFVVEFVEALDPELGLKDRVEAVIGGSLGGNLTLRLGRRHDLPWMKNIVSWSPASIWTGLADGADLFKQLGVATAWKRAGGESKYVDETPGTRNAFFEQAFGGKIAIGPIVIVPAQPDQWYRKGWECFDAARWSARIDRQETYHPNFRLWHWRLGVEQLIYSHQKPPNLKTPRYLDNHVRTLLLSGSEDNFNFTGIYSATIGTAAKMIHTPGQAIFVVNTGHSIQSERPNFLAGEIAAFLRK